MSSPAGPGEPPSGFVVRSPGRDDLDGIVAVMRASEIAASGDSLVTPGEILFDWADPRFSLERDAWAALDDGGRLLAYAYSFGNDPADLIDLYVVVHPEAAEQGLDDHLLGLALRRCREQAAEAGLDPAATSVGAPCLRGDARLRALLQRRGFAHTRVFLRMVIDVADLPAPPVWPDGIAVTAFRPGADDRTLHAVIDEAFLDHFHARPVPYDAWAAQVYGDEDFDPDLVLIAHDGDEAVGAVVALALPEMGDIDLLAVRRPWRGHGLGTALLIHMLHRLAARGYDRCCLGVDAQNTTGAAGLYRRVGMRPQRENDFFERTLGEAD